jgi:hypothetical protein
MRASSPASARPGEPVRHRPGQSELRRPGPGVPLVVFEGRRLRSSTGVQSRRQKSSRSGQGRPQAACRERPDGSGPARWGERSRSRPGGHPVAARPPICGPGVDMCGWRGVVSNRPSGALSLTYSLTTRWRVGHSPQGLNGGWEVPLRRAEGLASDCEHHPRAPSLLAEDSDIAPVLKTDIGALAGCCCRQKTSKGPVCIGGGHVRVEDGPRLRSSDLRCGKMGKCGKRGHQGRLIRGCHWKVLGPSHRGTCARSLWSVPSWSAPRTRCYWVARTTWH